MSISNRKERRLIGNFTIHQPKNYRPKHRWGSSGKKINLAGPVISVNSHQYSFVVVDTIDDERVIAPEGIAILGWIQPL